MLLCGTGRAIAAGKTAGDGEGDHIAAVTKGLCPVSDIRTCTVRPPLSAAQYSDHLVHIQKIVITKFLCVCANSKRNTDEVCSVQRENVAAGVCDDTKLIHGVASE